MGEGSENACLVLKELHVPEQVFVAVVSIL